MIQITLKKNPYMESSKEIMRYSGDVPIKKTPITLYINMDYNSYSNIKAKKNYLYQNSKMPMS